jgi:hypothetical protein
MKILHVCFFVSCATSLAALLSSGCSKPGPVGAAVDQTGADVKQLAADTGAVAADSWDGIKSFTYEQRVDFSAHMDRLTANLDGKADAFRAKVAGASDSAAQDRASAGREYDAARAELKSNLDELGRASSDTWADAKAKVAQSWKRVRAAYDKLAAGTVS